ncbi:hypothetical protein [Actinoplanes flavus]|uniref:Uncharacterized protein n=1 Tax=Actinoplanes flavus TaxID=2820290 RepID=A0ABS3UZ74_9ACTN|nr:hypothetical protein [Actinoplanes flavus]MBO3743880.1 hypothetical protein [Actinoplanes flavus]
MLSLGRPIGVLGRVEIVVGFEVVLVRWFGQAVGRVERLGVRKRLAQCAHIGYVRVVSLLKPMAFDAAERKQAVCGELLDELIGPITGQVVLSRRFDWSGRW